MQDEEVRVDKSTLRQYMAIVRETEQLETERQQIMERLQGAVQYSGMPGAKGGISDPVGNAAAKLAEVKTMLDEKLDQLADMRLAIESAIDGLAPEERRLMRCRYIEGKTWEQVAVELNYCIQHVWRLHGEILSRMREDERK